MVYYSYTHTFFQVSLLWLLRLLRLRLLEVLPQSCHSRLRFLAEKRCKDRKVESYCTEKKRSKSNQNFISYYVYNTYAYIIIYTYIHTYYIFIYIVNVYHVIMIYACVCVCLFICLLIRLFVHWCIYALPSVPSCHGPYSMAPRLRLFRPPRRRDLPPRTGSLQQAAPKSVENLNWFWLVVWTPSEKYLLFSWDDYSDS